MAEIERHEHLWPLFVTVMPANASMAELKSYFAHVDTLYGRRERFATLVETSAVRSIPSAAERKFIADYQNETLDKIQQYNVFTATVVPSPLIRGSMTAIRWLFKPPNEQVTVGTFGEGLTLCVDKLKADGVVVPVPLQQLALRGGHVTLDDFLRVRAA